MDPDIPISLSIGFALRIFLWAFDRQTIVRPLFLGIWEGIALYRGLSTSPGTQLNAYLACALRLAFDSLFTETIHTMLTILLSLVVAVLFSDALGSHHGHDIQLNRRSKRTRVNGTRTTEIYEAPDSHPRFIETPNPHAKKRDEVSALVPSVIYRPRFVDQPHPRHAEKVDEVYATFPSPSQSAFKADIVQPMDHPRRVILRARSHDSESPSPLPVHTAGVPLPATLNPLTPPCTPPEPGPSRFLGALDIPSPNSESQKDELQTPTSLVAPQTFSSHLPKPDNHTAQQPEEEDELQTPLALDLRSLPVDADLHAAEHGRLENDAGQLLSEEVPFLNDSASIGLDAEIDNMSELSLQTGTELSIISAIDAQLITAKAERLRKEAWEEQKQKSRLERELGEAVSRRKIKDAFLLRREIEAVEARAQKLHRRAARRHFR
ncbi:hypothetical protein B0H11DRAFT_101330 [Mycena galericulata]|nr:hypothetical protein B0H11DRAFT_101330 [Mycena galericulata]